MNVQSLDVGASDRSRVLIALERALVEIHEGTGQAASDRVLDAIRILSPGEVDVRWVDEDRSHDDAAD